MLCLKVQVVHIGFALPLPTAYLLVCSEQGQRLDHMEVVFQGKSKPFEVTVRMSLIYSHAHVFTYTRHFIWSVNAPGICASVLLDLTELRKMLLR